MDTIKEEYYPYPSLWEQSEYGVTQPRPIEGLNEFGPPPFLTKTYDMVDDSNTNDIVSWSRGGQSFVVWDTHSFSTFVLSNYFKHNNFSSFVRQLNTYGFRKIDPDKWEFANEAFLQGQKNLLKNIRRRKTPSQSLPSQQDQTDTCVEEVGLDGEIDQLRHDKHLLMMELVKLRQQQQKSRGYLQQMEVMLQGTERKQQQMMSFMARAMQNPEFIHQLVQHKEKRKELEEAVSKKRHRPIEYGESSQINKGKNPIKSEPTEFGESDGYYKVSELEALALEMQGFGNTIREEEDGEEEERELTRLGNCAKELDDGFWEELLNERFEGMPKNEEQEEDVNILVDRLGFLGSSPK